MSCFKCLLFCVLFFIELESSSSSLYKKAFELSWTQDYIPLACSDNLMRFFKRIGSPTDAKIIHVFHKNVPHAPVTPLMQRLTFEDKTFKPSSWTFHAFLTLNKKVYDLDYSSSPQVVDLDIYFNTMWDFEKLNSVYFFQTKSAQSYGPRDTDGTMDLKTSPILTFKELKDQLNF